MSGWLKLSSDPLTALIGLTALLGVGVAVWGLVRAFWDQRARRPEGQAELRGVPCPYCRGRVARGDVLCSHCYRDLKLNCPRCGETVSIQARTCPHCQAELLPEPNPKPGAPPAPAGRG